MKVYAPKTGVVNFKIENKDNSAMSMEVGVNVTKVGEWEELTFDFSAADPANTYNKIALFFDFMVADESEFYFDDIRQAAEMPELTEADLTRGSSKTWKLRPAAGSFGVGQGKGMDNYWPAGNDISADRPCLFNDEFIFKSGGIYEYDSKGDIFGEGYLGVSPDGCVDESELAPEAAAWGSGTHSFTFTPATETDPAYITVTGTGAFIALPKAYNGGEHSAGPPPTEGSVQYEVYGYTKNATNEALFLTLDISGTGETYWSFVLIAE